MTGVEKTVKDALARGFKKVSPHVDLTSAYCPPHGAAKYYVSCLEENLLPNVLREYFEHELRQGDGKKLEWSRRSGRQQKPRFWAIHSSAALAINTFAPFKRNREEISHALWPAVGNDRSKVEKPLECFHFEDKYKAWKEKEWAANLDLAAKGDEHIIAIESKLIEYTSPKKQCFAKKPSEYDAYDKNICDDRRCGPWFRAICEFDGKFEYLNFGQLIKHALALARELKGKDVTLLYLYWEPKNWGEAEFELFLDHQDEIARFSRYVEGGFPRFKAMSYWKLWDAWEKLEEPVWLKDHLANLRARYDVCL